LKEIKYDFIGGNLMESPTIKALFSDLHDRLNLKLNHNEIACPICKGLRFVLIQEGDYHSVESCINCHTGKLYVCKHCGRHRQGAYCLCEKAMKEIQDKCQDANRKTNIENYNKAEKIHYKDYDGKFIVDDKIVDIDGVVDWIEGLIFDNEDVPEFLWATESNQQFSIDLFEIIKERCDDGYEDMYDFLDINSYLLESAQELIGQWEKEQGELLYTYYETNKAVIIKDLIDKIKMSKSN
jgi:hypothetical protein